MIRSFRHKGFERFFTSSSRAGIQAAHARASRGNCLRYWRLTFAFVNGDAILVDYQDYH